METKCQYSKILIPCDPGYAGVAAAYAASVGEKLGFGTRDIEDIKLCTERVVAWAIDYSLAENEKASVTVSCEVISEGFKIVVNDHGVPFEPSMLKGGESKDISGIFHTENRMDEILFNNLGPEGKEVVLIKYTRRDLITDLFNACVFEPNAIEPSSVRPPDTKLIVRPMKPHEAIEVSKCVYKGYGNTYPHDHVYYPTKLAELNKDNSMFSAIAVSEQGDIAGHCALLYESGGHRIAEMGMGVVRPEYRSMGCFKKLTAFLIDRARADHLKGLYVRAVAAHTYSQQAAARFALKETGLQLAFIPGTVDFKRIANARTQRVAVFLSFRYLIRPSRPQICPPAKHENMIIDLYNHLGVQPVERPPADPEVTVFDTESRIHVKVAKAINYARIIIENYGKNIIRKISRCVTELCQNKIEVLNLYMDLSDPRTGPVSEELETLGFIFSGILPSCMPNGSDALIFQYLHNVAVNYAEVQPHSEMAQKLLDYVREDCP